MNAKKLLLYALLALLAASLWSAWQHDHPASKAAAGGQDSAVPAADTPPVGVTTGASTSNSPAHHTPQGSTGGAPQGVAPQTSSSQVAQIPAARLVHVKTDLLEADIDTQGGNLVSLHLLKYAVSLKDKSPINLLNPNADQWYVMQSGLVSAPGYPAVDSKQAFTSKQKTYQLADGQHSIDVVLTGTNAEHLQLTKTYHFTRNRYVVGLSYSAKNTGSKAWKGSFFTQLQRRDIKQTHKAAGRAYVGAAISSAAVPYKKVSYAHLLNNPLSQNIHGGWVAMQQHYFLTAVLPEVYQTNHYYSQVSEATNPKGAMFTMGYAAPQVEIKPGASTTGKVRSYMGPALSSRLDQVGEHLGLTIDYGWLSIFSTFIFKVMNYIHQVVGNWGWSIILVTLLIKLVLYPFTQSSFKSMAKMKELNPKLQKLRERYANDKQQLSQATMKLYRDEKVNPLGGCLPMLVQIPIFIALYYVLIESVQLRQAPFIFWIHDLSVKDPFYVLPIVMGASMFLQQKLTPQAADPQQAKVMMFLPVIFTVFFLNFPAGLVLYWLTNNVLQIAQQWFVGWQYEKEKASNKYKKPRGKGK